MCGPRGLLGSTRMGSIMVGLSHLSQRGKRKFWMQGRGAKSLPAKSPPKCANARGDQGSANKWRPIRPDGGVRSQVRTGLQLENREFLENFRPKQALGGSTVVGHCKFRRDSSQLRGRPSTFLLFCKTGA